MKKLFTKALFCFSAVMAMTVCSCSMLETPQIPDEETDIIKDTQVYRIHVGLHGAGADTRLSYQDAIVDGKNVMKTLWSEGDALTANASPGSETDFYTFIITEGIGTGTGVFECKVDQGRTLPEYLTSNAWTIYYPGSIKGEQDYFDMTYIGQTQNGNGSTAHLEDYHSLRLGIEGSVTFKNSYINLSGDNLNESMCMKFNLSNLPSGITPTRIELTNVASNGTLTDLFYTHNYLTTWWEGATPNGTKTSTMSLDLTGFTETTSVTAYMMLSNAQITVVGGSKLKVTVTASDGSRYYCEKPVGADVTLKGGTMNSITCSSWTEAGTIDGFDDPANGIVVLQEATSGNGTDIVIMGDGFAATDEHFGASGDYKTIMTQAYNDLFSVEPFKTLKPYFNVYYINAVSEEDHDASPYIDAHGNQNGATQGTASTRFNTQFTPGATTITGNNDLAIEYAAQAIKSKGGKNGASCDEQTAVTRANKALIMVMVNVECHAGTCSMAWTNDPANDYGNAYSVAYTALGNTAEQRRWTTIHEAGGHGFGKLADEYGGYQFTSFNTSLWNDLDTQHSYGLYRNVNMHWTAEDATQWNSSLSETYTDESNVYWSDLLADTYGYKTSEGLGIYKGGFTYEHLFCRPTDNSIMRNQFGTNGQFFNAVSRWAIWYRLMRLTGSTSRAQFKASIEDFITFDKTISITMNELQTKGSEMVMSDEYFVPTAPPVMIPGYWENGRFVAYEQ